MENIKIRKELKSQQILKENQHATADKVSQGSRRAALCSIQGIKIDSSFGTKSQAIYMGPLLIHVHCM